MKSPYEEHIWIYDWQINMLDLKDIDMYKEILQFVHANHVLEMGCGTGRITEQLAKLDLKITGVDLSTHMLDQAKLRLDKFKNVTLHQGDMETFLPDLPIDVVIIPFSTFLCLTDTFKQHQVLKNISYYLNDGGHVIIDIFEPNVNTLKAKRSWRKCLHKHHPECGEVIKYEKIDLNLDDRRFDVISKYFIDGEEHRDTLSLSLVTGDELENQMKKFFTIVNRWGDYDFSQKGPKCILMGRKDQTQ